MAAEVFMCSPRRPRSRVRSVLLKPQVPEDDDDSDTDEPSPPPASGVATSARAHASAAPLPPRAGPGREEPSRPQQIIHSGHFMVSSPHREHPPKKGYDFDTVNKQTCQTYSFGKTSSCHLSIDASLTKLFECMTLAYSGKLVSPKWKNFKGLKLQWRDKIRLNNAIWRAWYMQYLEKRKNPVCHFVTPLDGSVDVDEHRRPEAITTEGKYWKSRIEFVIREYHKWRTYFKKRLQQHKDEDLSSLAQDDDILYWHKHGDGWKTPVPMEEDPLLDTDMLMSEFSDTLFSTLSSHQPVAWPNPREIAHLGNADMIQPGLIPLQPNLDFMDTFEPFQDLFSSSRSIFGSLLPTPASASVPDPNSPSAQGSVLQTSALPTVSLPDSLIVPSAAPSLDPTAAFPGQPQAVIMTSGPLKREGILASTVSQSSVVIAPASIARAPGVTEFHSSVLVTDLSHSTNSQPTPVSRLFSPSTVPDSLVKGEQTPLHGGSPQGPASGSSRDCPNSGKASPCASEQSPSPQSPQNSCSGKSADTKNVFALKQHRHISAEQKRRFNIKMGFDTLNSLISNNSKLTSHAITLQKTVEYITKLQQERSQMQEEARRLRDEIEELNTTIISCQQLLPATGVSVTRLQYDHMRDMFDEYVKSRILQNWKFWIFSIIIKPLFESFKGMVSTGSLEELHQTTLSWLDQHCSLPILRPMVLSTLRQLSITTSVLTDPSQLPEQASEAVTRIGKRSGES
ncbi:MLX-interacting protein isoform X3 [Marmota monax]|uniref:MLX-interacting protein isoform X3 n=1 Tax=Marmota monax TaxID=9995 RepID=UPI0026F30662|nr:MLX-interacting protein isoform X3 [Marmota monax]